MKQKIPEKLIPKSWETKYRDTISPIIGFFIRINIDPNTFTTIGFVISCVAAYYASQGEFRIAAVYLLLSGICDTIDGAVARSAGKVTKFGALYDSTLDRYAEVLFFLGMAVYFVHAEWYSTSVAIFVGLGGSVMVSYVRARAEGLGLECKVGILQRPERLILLVLGGLIHIRVLAVSVWIIAVLANLTAIQRILHVWKEDHNSVISSEVE